MKNLLTVLTIAFLFTACGKKSDTPAPDLKPVIISFTPQSGIAGATVNISGNNLSAVNSVKFNGVDAPQFRINGTGIDVQVPAGATTGYISVASPNGTGNSQNSFTVLATPVLPVITNVLPNNNPVGWAVMIQGDHVDGINSIKFNSTLAVMDENVPGIVTTTVPAGLSGTVNLTVTNVNGTSNSFPFTILSTNPVTATPAAKILLKNKGKYLPKVNNFWHNQYEKSPFSETITFNDKGNGKETLNGKDYAFTGTFDPANKTINLIITRGAIQDTYTGTYVDADPPSQQRIIFYDKANRQIVYILDP